MGGLGAVPVRCVRDFSYDAVGVRAAVSEVVHEGTAYSFR